MPLTFLAHQAPVLPLKMRWPGHFDGTALVVGSMMPDLLFLTYGTSLYVDAHRPWPQLWLCLPLTVIVTIAVKRLVAGSLGPHLPDVGEFHLRDYRRLSAWPSPRSARAWLVLVSSALIGSLSHLLLDAFTHNWGYAVEHIAALQTLVLRLPDGWPGSLSGYPLFVFSLLQLGLTVVLSAVTVWLVHRIGRRRRLVEWYPDVEIARPTGTSRRRVIVGAAGGALVGAVVTIAGWAEGTAHGLLFLVVDGAGLGVIVTGRWTRVAMAEPRADAGESRAA